jgi:MFS family permease
VRAPSSRSEPRLLVPSLLFIALVVAAVGSLGTPLITSVATTFHVSLASAQWTLTITLLSGAVATPLLGRLGAGPHRRGTILATLGIVVAGSVLTVLHLPFAWLLVGRGAQGIGLGLPALMMGVARDHLPEERASATIALVSVASTIGIGVGYPLAGLLTEFGGVRAAYGLGVLVTAIALLAALRSIPIPPAGRSAHLDAPGALLLAGGLFPLLLAVSETGLWTRHLGVAVALVAVALVLLCVWAAYERRTPSPLVDVRLVRHRAVAGTNAAMLVGGVGMYLLLTLITRYAQTPRTAGYGFGLTTFVSAPRTNGRIPAPGRQRHRRARCVRVLRSRSFKPGRAAGGDGDPRLRRRQLLRRHARRHPGRHSQQRNVERHELQTRSCAVSDSPSGARLVAWCWLQAPTPAISSPQTVPTPPRHGSASHRWQ